MAKSLSRLGIIGGSGLADALAKKTDGEFAEIDTPFGKPSAPILTTEIQGVPVAILNRHGRGHTFSPSSVPYRANIYALKALGVTHILASGACGSLAEHIHPGDLVICDQTIDKTFKRANSFFEDYLAVHVDFAFPFCQRMRSVLLSAAGSLKNTTVHEKGTYVCMEGPQFSTQAESLMHRQWGGHVIGMTCLPEAKLAREAEICYALAALATDYDCWKPHEGDQDKHSLMAVIIENLNRAAENAYHLIVAALPALGQLLNEDCEHRHALELAIWSDKSHITDPAWQKLNLLINKYV